MPNKVRRAQTRRCATHNYIKPQEKARRDGGSINKSSATRKEKLAVHRVAKVVNKKWRQTLRKCEIKEYKGYWFVISNGVPRMYETMTDAINASQSVVTMADRLWLDRHANA